MKKCPYCAEEIQELAIKCKHCGEFLKKETDVATPVVEKPLGTKHVLRGIGWLELLIAYLCIFVPIGNIMGMGYMSQVIEKLPDLRLLGDIDTLLRFIFMFMSIYAGVCLLKSAKGAVKTVKIFLIAWLVFNIVVLKGIYSLVMYAELARGNINIPASAVMDALTSDVIGTIVISIVVVAWYIYLIKSRRVRETYNTSSTASHSQIVPPETKVTEE